MALARTKSNTDRFQGLFDNLFTGLPGSYSYSAYNSETLQPKVNIKQGADEYVIELALPGYAKEDLNIQLDQEVLTVSSEVKKGEETGDQHFTRKEFSLRSFKKVFHLPEDTDAEKVVANCKDGILSIRVPKKEEAKPQPPKTIEVV